MVKLVSPKANRYKMDRADRLLSVALAGNGSIPNQTR
jgi:hypothetical protein